MTEEQTPPVAAGPNLAILKGVVWGMGLLLVLGTVMIGVKMASLSSEMDEADPASEYVAAPMDLTALPPLPLRAGEQIIEISADEGMLFVIAEESVTLSRRVLIHSEKNMAWTELPVQIVTE